MKHKRICNEINKRLASGRIKHAITSEDGESYGFKVEMEDGSTLCVWIDSDEECNESGHLSIEKEYPTNLINVDFKESVYEILD